MLRLRLPLLRDDRFTHGRLQPFVSAGPALFIIYASQNRYVQPDGQSSTDVAVGAKVDAGATFMLTKLIGVFAQYRFTGGLFFRFGSDPRRLHSSDILGRARRGHCLTN